MSTKRKCSCVVSDVQDLDSRTSCEGGEGLNTGVLILVQVSLTPGFHPPFRHGTEEP